MNIASESADISAKEAEVSSRDSIIPGTTIAVADEQNGHLNGSKEHETSSRPGPVINGRPTTITLISPEALRHSSFGPSMVKKINAAYAAAHVRSGVFPPELTRLSSIENVYEEIGSVPQTVTFIIHYDTSEIVGTCTAWRFDNTKVLIAGEAAAAESEEAREKIRRSTTFKRLDAVADDVEAWELKMLAVDKAAQGQGLALLLIDLCMDEAKRHFLAGRRKAEANGVVEEKHLEFMLTCVREINAPFYRKLGFEEVSHRTFPKGTMDSLKEFNIANMTKRPDLSQH